MFNMLGALRRTGLEIQTIDKLSDPYRTIFRVKRIFKNLVLKRNYLRDREPLTLRWYARQVERCLSRIKPDLVFSAGTIPIAYLRSEKPIIFWADATFDGMIEYYPEYTNLCDETVRNGHNMEQAALSHCRLAIYSSEWAAKTALANYAVDSTKVKVVPYGANLARSPSAEEVQRAIASRGSDLCKLLFVGVDWHRKGGEEALLVTSKLRERGINAELHVVGCKAPSPTPAYVKTYGYLSKSNRKHNELLSRLFETSDFFILPSKAECAAVVVAEANAFGLPALTTKVGGMGTVVNDGKNGWAFEPTLFVEQCSERILELLSAKERYYELCRSSFGEYSRRLNWDSAVQSVLNLLAAPGVLRQ
jgi:glycosyltransferase involved in cell wall biosynthesis